MSDDALVTIIIPTYGRPEYLNEAVASALCQSYPAIEVIVIDDGSPEPVRVDMADGNRVRVIRHGRNMGPGASRNTGLAHARGTFVTFLDDDDLFMEDRVERGVLSIGEARFHAVQTNLHGRRFDGDMRSTLSAGPAPLVGQVLLRLEDAVQFDPALRVSEDVEWWLRMRDRAVFAWSDEPGLWYREHPADRPGVDPVVRFRCRELVALRHVRDLDRRSRAHQQARVGASALLAGLRYQTFRYATRSLTASPNTLAAKLLVHSLNPFMQR